MYYDLPERAKVVLTIYDILGRRVSALVNWVEELAYKPMRNISLFCLILFVPLFYPFEINAQEKERMQKGGWAKTVNNRSSYQTHQGAKLAAPQIRTNVTGGPEIILHNANVITMDNQMPSAEAIAIEGNLISVVGNNADILAFQSTGTELIDLEGRTVVPGLIDAHGHRLLEGFIDGGSEGLVLATQKVAADGYTTTHELGVNPDFIAAAQELAAEGRLSVRVNCYLTKISNCGDDANPSATDTYTEKKDTTLRLVGVKIFADGGSCFCPAITSVYQGQKAAECGAYGHLFKTQAEMNATVAGLLADGYPIAMHAIGDSAIGVGLNAFANAFGDEGNTLRSRMDHLIIMREDLADQMAKLGVAASIQYTFANPISAVRVESFYQPEVREWAYPWRRLADRGIPIVGGIDAPNAFRSQAMQAIGVLATRQLYPFVDVPAWMDGDQLTVEEGLRAMTVTNAWSVFEEDVKGTITPGKLADLTILSGDPLAVDPFDVQYITIEMTIMDGIIRHNQMGVTRTAIHDAGAFSIGFDDRGLWGPHRSHVGLVYQGWDHLFMGSLLISYNEDIYASAIPAQADYFTSFEGWIDFREPGTKADEEVTVVYEDAGIGRPGPIRIGQETFMWEDEPFLLTKFTFTNLGDSLLEDLYFAQFMDFDVAGWDDNMGGWEASTEPGFGYMYNASSPNTPYIGMAMFNSSGNYANSALTFTTGVYPEHEPVFAEYMRSDSIEPVTPEPRDYAILLASGPSSIDVNQSISPFMLAFVVGENIDDLKNALSKAIQKFAEQLGVGPQLDLVFPTEYALHPNYPNPFNPVTNIQYDLPKAGHVSLTVYDLLGRQVKILVNQTETVGYKSIRWDSTNDMGRPVSAGIYFYQLRAGEYTQTRKAVLIR